MKRVLIIIFTQLLFGLSLQAQTTQELRDSLVMINGLIAEHPKAVKLYLRKAALHIDLEQWNNALDDYNDVLQMIGEPNDTTIPAYTTALYFRGYVYQRIRRYVLARRDYEAVLKIRPTDMHAIMGLTLTNMEDDHDTEAYDGANRLVEMFPDTAQVYALRCEVEQHLNMPDAALEDILKAIEIEQRTVGNKYPFDDDDDIIGYELTAFNLYMEKKDKLSAKACLNYLAEKGTNKSLYLDQQVQLRKQKRKEEPHKFAFKVGNKTGRGLRFSSY